MGLFLPTRKPATHDEKACLAREGMGNGGNEHGRGDKGPGQLWRGKLRGWHSADSNEGVRAAARLGGCAAEGTATRTRPAALHPGFPAG